MMKFDVRTAAAVFIKLYLLVLPRYSFLLILYLLLFSTYGRYSALAYIAWWIIDRNTPENGGRSWTAFRSWHIHKLAGEYLPIKVHKTADLPENENYFFACFPHGVLPIGQLFSMMYYSGTFSKVFPKINARLCATDAMFHLPFFREIVLWAGLLASSEKSLKNFLKVPKSGVAAAMTVGGVREALLTERGKNKLYLKKRKGFCRVALQTGAHLVPVYGFGENDTFAVQYQFVSENTFWSLEKRFGNIGGLVALFLHPKGGSFFGFLPRRVPVNIVYGAPIPVQKTENPTEEEISKLQEVFIAKLTDLFEQEKHKYIENASEVHLEFV